MVVAVAEASVTATTTIIVSRLNEKREEKGLGVVPESHWEGNLLFISFIYLFFCYSFLQVICPTPPTKTWLFSCVTSTGVSDHEPPCQRLKINDFP